MRKYAIYINLKEETGENGDGRRDEKSREQPKQNSVGRCTDYVRLLILSVFTWCV